MSFLDDEPTLYDRLKVTRDAPVEVIRAAYRALAALHHPDRVGANAQTHDEMAGINAAYTVLINPARRERYDARLASGTYVLRRNESRARYAAATEIAEDSVLPHDSGSSHRGSVHVEAHHPYDDGPPTGFSETRVDVDWMDTPMKPHRHTHRREAWVLASAFVVAVGTGYWVSRQQYERAQAELALTAHLRQPPAGLGPQPAVGGAHDGLLAPGASILAHDIGAAGAASASVASPEMAGAAFGGGAGASDDILLATTATSAGPVLSLQAPQAASAASAAETTQAASTASAPAVASGASGMPGTPASAAVAGKAAAPASKVAPTRTTALVIAPTASASVTSRPTAGTQTVVVANEGASQ